jgi:ring-1,2-phenylacetyl-CoA epoxidase subunit PaaA
VYTEPDWQQFSAMVRDNSGPKSQERVNLRRRAHEEQAWVREAMRRSAEVAVGV